MIQYDYSDYTHGMGFITTGQVKTLKEKYEQCEDALNNGVYTARACFENMDLVLSSISNPHGFRLNFYDVRDYVLL